MPLFHHQKDTNRVFGKSPDVSRRNMEAQYNFKKKKLTTLKKELCEKQKPIMDLYKSLVDIKRKYFEIEGVDLPLDDIKLVQYHPATETNATFMLHDDPNKKNIGETIRGETILFSIESVFRSEKSPRADAAGAKHPKSLRRNVPHIGEAKDHFDGQYLQRQGRVASGSAAQEDIHVQGQHQEMRSPGDEEAEGGGEIHSGFSNGVAKPDDDRRK